MRLLFVGLIVFIMVIAITTVKFLPKKQMPEKQVYYSLCKQDQFVNEHFFKNKKNGVFVDIGAYDGVEGSNTYFFEKILNWTGICVEPVSLLFEKLRESRACVCVNGCISDKEGEAKFLKITGPGGSVGMGGGLFDKYEPEQSENLQKYFTEGTCRGEIISAKCYTLERVLKENNINHIDYLSVDVEGAEFDILKSINFDEIDIDVIDVENNFEKPQIRNFLQSKNFMFVSRVGNDDIFRKSSYIES